MGGWYDIEDIAFAWPRWCCREMGEAVLSQELHRLSLFGESGRAMC